VTVFSRFLCSYIPIFCSADIVGSLTFVVDVLVLKIIVLGYMTPLSLKMNYRLCVENQMLLLRWKGGDWNGLVMW